MGDFLEVRDFCGYDIEAADEMVKDRPKYTPELMDRIMEDSCVD